MRNTEMLQTNWCIRNVGKKDLSFDKRLYNYCCTHLREWNIGEDEIYRDACISTLMLAHIFL